MALFVAMATYGRPKAFALSIKSILRTKVVKGIITAIDLKEPAEEGEYRAVLTLAQSHGLEVLADISPRRRGSTNARNKVLDIAEQNLKDDDVLVLYDDDYICPSKETLISAAAWLRRTEIGAVGGRVINLTKRRTDPDFYLDIIPGLADTLTKLTGFIFLDVTHGPRYVDFTTPLMAMRVDVIKKGVRYDPNYTGTAYREESDLQLQIRKLGYKIVFEPNFYAYHLALEEGGNRELKNVAQRFYWKTRNNTYFIIKNKLGLLKLISSSMIISFYAILNGPSALKATMIGLTQGLKTSKLN